MPLDPANIREIAITNLPPNQTLGQALMTQWSDLDIVAIVRLPTDDPDFPPTSTGDGWRAYLR